MALYHHKVYYITVECNCSLRSLFLCICIYITYIVHMQTAFSLWWLHVVCLQYRIFVQSVIWWLTTRTKKMLLSESIVTVSLWRHKNSTFCSQMQKVCGTIASMWLYYFNSCHSNSNGNKMKYQSLLPRGKGSWTRSYSAIIVMGTQLPLLDTLIK